MSAKLPLVGDPKARGPVDILAEWKARAERFVDENSRILIPSVLLAFVVLVGLAWRFDVGMPSMPNWGWVTIVATIVAAPYGWILGKLMAKGLYSSNVEVLSVQDPGSGDQELVKVDPDRFRDMRVVNQNGKVRDTGFLQTVHINGVRAYEVDQYHRDRNVATASWMAGETNSSIRADKRQIKRIKNDLEREADKAMELLANYPEILRQHATEVANRLVKASVGMEIPEGSKLHERLNDTIEQADPSEDLLSDDGDSDDEDDERTRESDVAGDIFDRAQAAAQAAEAATDGGREGGSHE